MFFGNQTKKASGSNLVELLKNSGEPTRRPRRMVVAEPTAICQAPEKTAAPVIYSEDLIQCPCCGLTQHANRTRCFDCGVYFSMGN